MRVGGHPTPHARKTAQPATSREIEEFLKLRDRLSRSNLGATLGLAGVLFVGAAAVVGVELLAGPSVLDRIASADPSPSGMRDQSAIRLSRLAAESAPESDALQRPVLLSGASAGGCIVMAGGAERGDQPGLAHLWLALDSEARGLPSLARQHEALAKADPGALQSIVPKYDRLRDWAKIPSRDAKKLADFQKSF